MEKIPHLFDLLTGDREQIAASIRNFAREAGVREEEAAALSEEAAGAIHGNRAEVQARLRFFLSTVAGVAGEKLGFVTRAELEPLRDELRGVRAELAEIKRLLVARGEAEK
ncbi:MAG: hypothetical protein HYZ53_07540 [Planctomycetes bacterium]|nr:hypothetical protein [Planctomycetota bacterium]